MAGAAVLVVLLALAWFGDAGSAIPIASFGEPGTETMLQPPGVALWLVERALAPYGGMPHDAYVADFTPRRLDTFVEGDADRVVSVTGYNLSFAPRDAIQSDSRITARVGLDTVRTCLDGGTLESPYAGGRRTEPSCRHYRIAFALRVAELERHWWPRPLRVVRRRWDTWFAPQFAEPESVEEGCNGRNMGAFRRALAAATIPFTPKGYVDVPALWERAVQQAADGHGVLARWDSPYPALRFEGPRYGAHTDAEISEAIVSDVPVVPGWRDRLVLVRAPRPIGKLLVGVLGTTDDEPVCPASRVAQATPPPAYQPPWDALVRVVRARSEDEIRRLAAFRGTTLGSRVVAADHHPGAISTIDVETWIGRVRWRGRFTIDERVPELRDADFTRLAGG
ncbi:MAG: hypothetical protein QOJ39_774 [Candidatus Eremiobacteraeota bacterium]|jgi:hypothetical protein|nr:hypothetical protein [Candidatus Eremiobacteraeota bacterium]